MAARTVGWIGLGNMGAPMTANLVKAGFEVRGFDLSEHAQHNAAAGGVRIAGSAAEAVTGADIVFTMLPGGEQVEAVLTGPDGVLDAIAEGTLVVDSSTIDITTARRLHEQVTAAGRRFLDAPVSGGVSGATAGTLSFMVGGSAENLAEAQPVIEAMAGHIFHMGGPGNGQAAKIVNNLMLGVCLAATVEGAVLAERLGLDAKEFLALASASSGDSWALRTWYPIAGVVETAPVNRGFTNGFTTNLLRKDLGLALAAGEATGTPLHFAEEVYRRMTHLAEAGHGAEDCTILVKLVDGSLESHTHTPTNG